MQLPFFSVSWATVKSYNRYTIICEAVLCNLLTLQIRFLSILMTKTKTNKYLLTYLLTYSTEQSLSWKANWFSTNQEIPRILWNPKVHYLIHKYLSPVPILSQLDLVHTPTSQFLKIHLNIILPSKPGSPKLFFPSGFHTKNPVYTSPYPIRATYLAHLILLYFITRAILGEEYGSLSSSLCSFLHSPFTSCLLGPNILLNTLFSNTLCLRETNTKK